VWAGHNGSLATKGLLHEVYEVIMISPYCHRKIGYLA
jgi:hypothetical protein